jgi:hypothetical protein
LGTADVTRRRARILALAALAVAPVIAAAAWYADDDELATSASTPGAGRPRADDSCMIRVLVLDRAGAPVPDVAIVIDAHGGQPDSGPLHESGPDGSVSFSLAPGKWALRAFPRDGRFASEPEVVDICRRADVTLRLK